MNDDLALELVQELRQIVKSLDSIDTKLGKFNELFEFAPAIASQARYSEKQ